MKNYALLLFKTTIILSFFFVFTPLSHPVFAQIEISEVIEEKENTLTVKDYLTLTRIGSPRLSPDGAWIAYTVGKKEKWDGKRITNIWLKKADNSKTKQLTNSEKADYSPKWSPDGSMIAFVSARPENRQVYVISVSGGEAKQITKADNGVSSFSWIGNNSIAYTSEEPRDSAIVATEEAAGGAHIVGTEDHTSALWVQSLDEEKSKKITNGSYYINEFAVSSDGKLFCMVISPNSHMYSHLTGGSIMLINDKGESLYTFKDANTLGQPGISPNSKKISFVGCSTGYSENNSLFVVDVKTKAIKNVTKEFDPTIQHVQWLSNESIAFSTPRHATTGIYSVPAKGGEIKTLLKPHFVINSFSIHPKSKKIAFTGTKNKQPNELKLAAVGSDPARAKLYTDFNQWITKKSLSNSMIVQYPSYDKVQIEAVLHLPLNYAEGGKYPLMVLPHGGPDGISTDKFSLFGQLFAREGFIVFETNFRGSIGYGIEIYQANRGRLGDVDYKDIMAGVDYLIEKGMVDSAKMVVGGWSYGGYMTNWMIGHTNRFKAAVCVAGIANTVSMYAQSDINHGEIAKWEFKGVPVINMENFHRASPIEFLKNCKTPTLILHGEADARVPVAQAWEVYRALEDIGAEVKMVLYPGAGHSIRTPKQFVNVMDNWMNWYRKHLE